VIDVAEIDVAEIYVTKIDEAEIVTFFSIVE
jgi:hypothetical protein